MNRKQTLDNTSFYILEAKNFFLHERTLTRPPCLNAQERLAVSRTSFPGIGVIDNTIKRNIPKESEKSESHLITYKLIKINDYPNDFAYKNDVTIYSN